MSFKPYTKAYWIRDSISISYQEKPPTLDALRDMDSSFPNPGDYDDDTSVNKSAWKKANAGWYDNTINKRLLRRHVVEVKAHSKVASGSINMSALNAYIKQGGAGTNLIPKVKTSAGWDGESHLPAGTYCINNINIIDEHNGCSVITASWRQYGKFYMYSLEEVT